MSSLLQQLLMLLERHDESLWWALPAFSFALLFSLAAWFLLGSRLRPSYEQRRRKTLEALPSPPRLPLLGNLLQLGTHAHRSLRTLSVRHGPVMLLRFGSVPTVVVSSAAAAEEVMRIHDLSFASRPTSPTSRRLLYDGRDLAFAKYGEYWRQLRRVCVLHLLSNKRVQSFRPVREEELALLLGRIRRANGTVNLSDLVVVFTSDVICRVAFGKKYSTEAGGGGTWFRDVLREFGVLLGAFSMREYIPLLGWVDWLSGLDGRIKKNSTEMDAFIEKVLEEHPTKKSNNRTADAADSDFIDILESLESEGTTTSIKLCRDSVKAILLDMFAAGTDTTSSLIVWTMAEIIKHPKEMKRLQEEVRRVVGPKAEVCEEMTKRMEYLQAVIKETMRLHPPGPLLVPREAIEGGAQIQGYEVPAGTRVVVNAWAIGRDPESWPVEPEEWRPERFLRSSVDFKGKDFQLIPFGAGRRGCPGMAFALANVELLLASLLYHFDWELPDGKKGETLDMAEVSGIVVYKKSNLVLVAKPVATENK